MQWLLDLWSKNKILFFLLIPLVLLAFGLKMYQEYQYAKAKKSLVKTQVKSEEIKKKVEQQEAEANTLMEEANESSDRRKAREESDKLNLDWHNKKED